MKNDKPFFSIIMPVYKAEPYINDSILSVLNQSFSSFELICINDFTDDNAFNICVNHASKDNRVRCIDSDHNVGQSETRNKGLKDARGDYVLFLDSDDKLEDNALQTIFNSINNSHPDCVVFGYKNIYNDGKKVEILGNIEEGLYSQNNFYSHILIELDHPFISCVGTKAYKMELIKKNNLFFNPRFLYNEDLGFALNAFSCCESFYYINKCLYLYYRVNTSSVMSSYKANMFYHVMLARELYCNFISDKDIKQMANFYSVVIGGAFDGLRSERKFMDKVHFNNEIINISEHPYFIKAHNFVIKHKKLFPFKKRIFVYAVSHKLKRVLWSFVK